MNLELLTGSGYGIIVPDPAKNERSDTVNKNVISHFKPLNSGLCALLL